ncbi:MAG: hypothetical protein AB1424_13620 [Thermodesulfobacteriota bacterium]
MTITPQWAREMLAVGNHRDRPLSQTRVKKLAAAIRRGEWCTNGDCIAFDVNGKRINGQHRLSAIIEADTPVQALVGYNFPENAFMTTDVGAKRTTADLAVIIGMKKHYMAVGAAINLLWRYKQGTLHTRGVTPTNTQLIDLLQENPQIEKSAELGVGMWSVLSPAVATFCHYLFQQIDPFQANAFFKSLRTGANLAEGDPILVLRNRMIAQKAQKGILPQHEIVALVIKTWNYHRRGHRVKHLGWQYRKGERFPVAK